MTPYVIACNLVFPSKTQTRLDMLLSASRGRTKPENEWVVWRQLGSLAAWAPLGWGGAGRMCEEAEAAAG